jgi:hypothetical protein
MASVEHKDATQVHLGAHVGSADPAADVTQDGVLWIDTTSGYVLKVRTGTNTAWTTIGDLSAAGAGIPEALIDALGDLVYGSAADTAARLAGNITTTKKFLTQTGDGALSAAPGWNVLVSGDIPTDAALAGNPTTTTQSAGNSTTRIATTAFVTTADDLKANLASPTFTGTVTLPADQALSGNPTTTTQSAGNSTTRIATTAFVAAAVTKAPTILEYALSDETTAITTGLKLTTRAPFAFTLTNVRISLTTTSSSGNPAVDMKESGTTVFSTTPKIDSGELTNVTGTAAVISDSAIADDAELTFIVDTAGTGAKGLKIRLYVTPT